MRKKITMALVMAFVMAIGLIPPVVAHAETQEEIPVLPQVTAVVSITNIETGETQDFYEEISYDLIEQVQIQTRSGETYLQFSANIAVDFDFSEDMPQITIVPLSSQGSFEIVMGTRAEVGITATTRVQSGSTQINVSSFFGSWTVSNPSLFFMSNRSASLSLGTPGSNVRLTPTSNTFRHSPNWGWAIYTVNASAGTDAIINASGMGSSHRITTGFNFG